MEVASSEKGPLGTWGLIVLALVAVGLIIAAVLSLVNVFSPSAAKNGEKLPEHDSVAGGRTAEMTYPSLPQEELDRQHAEYKTPPVTRPPVTRPVVSAPPPVIPVKKESEAVILQKTKAAVNQKLVVRLKQYVKDHPQLDNRELEKQIAIREKQCAPVP